MLNDANELNELNEKAARAMGWTRRRVARSVDCWDAPAGQESDSSHQLPDFCRDVMAYGYMMGWLRSKQIPFCLDGTAGTIAPKIFYTARLDSARRSSGYRETPGMALAAAIINHVAQSKGTPIMPYKRPPPGVGPLFVVCNSCGYLTIEPAPDHCKQPLEHRQEADGVHLENSVHLDTDALVRRLGAIGRHFDGRA